MSSEEVELCVAIIEDHFGKPVASVANVLLTQPQLRLASIYKELEQKLSVKELKRALVILAQHKLLAFDESTAAAQPDHSERCFYSVRKETVLQLILVPWALYLVKTHYGKVAVDQWIDWPRSGGSFSKLECLLRNELVMELLALNEIFDTHALKVTRLLLDLTATKGSLPGVTFHDLIQRARDEEHELELTADLINSRLELLECESRGVVRRILDSGGGTYSIDYGAAIAELSFKHVESVIKQRLDGNALRIFRLLRSNAGTGGHGGNYLEEEQIERHAMIPSTEARKACSALLEAGFISVRHICRSIDFAPSRTYYLYGVSEQQLLAHMSQLAILTLRNLVRRRMHEADSHVALTDRHFKMEAIIANIQADASLDDKAKREQRAEVEREYLSAGDRLQLDKFKRAQQRLSASEIEVARSLFIVQQHLFFIRQQTCVVPMKRRARASAGAGGGGRTGAVTTSTASPR